MEVDMKEQTCLHFPNTLSEVFPGCKGKMLPV